VAAEPFNRGMDDASAQTGQITVDGLTFESGYGNDSTPLVQISDNDLGGDAETHFRNVTVHRPEQFADRWPLVNRGVGPRAEPLAEGVPIFIHDYYGPGRHAKIVSAAAEDLLGDGHEYRSEPPLTGNECRVAEVEDVEWPELLEPVDDLPPATVVTSVTRRGGKLLIRGVSHDNGDITAVTVNDRPATILSSAAGVVDWEILLNHATGDKLVARAEDSFGNVEQTPHVRHWRAEN
jgi:hypothetical protein